MATQRRRKESNGTAHVEGKVDLPAENTGRTDKADEEVSMTVADVLQIYLPTLGLIFGGCCSNVYALEALIKTSHSSGSLITFLQFAVTSLLTMPANVSLREPSSWRHAFLRKRHIPLRAWIIYTAFFLAINVLNNTAFSYRISVPLHIILRSAGPVTTMLVFYFFSGRRYPPIKIFAVLLLFIGVVVAAVSDAFSKKPDTLVASSFDNTSLTTPSSDFLRNQGPGFLLLASALLLSAFMGLYSDGLYAKYGRSAAVTSESLFYSHTLPLPFFAYQLPTLTNDFMDLAANSAPLSMTLATGPISKLPSFLDAVPTAIPMLLLNALTQYVCISGVNRLSAKSSSLTVSIVLNVRKLISLLLSIWLFGNRLPQGVVVGAALVFLGGGLYAVPSQPATSEEKKIS
jgi:solute carrier family 35 (UDP-xylose/UDP-N-acetylglucosamine transporter), member B4